MAGEPAKSGVKSSGARPGQKPPEGGSARSLVSPRWFSERSRRAGTAHRQARMFPSLPAPLRPRRGRLQGALCGRPLTLTLSPIPTSRDGGEGTFVGRTGTASGDWIDYDAVHDRRGCTAAAGDGRAGSSAAGRAPAGPAEPIAGPDPAAQRFLPAEAGRRPPAAGFAGAAGRAAFYGEGRAVGRGGSALGGQSDV